MQISGSTAMKNNSRPPPAPNNHRRMSANPFAAVLRDDDNNQNKVDVETVQSPDSSTNETLAPILVPVPLPPRAMESNNYKDIVDDETDDGSSQGSQSSDHGRVRPPRPSMAVVTGKSKRNLMQQRRRRRSSARFLQLSKTKENVEENDDDDEDNKMENGMAPPSQNHTNSTLQEMYQTAIRMNAENKINTTNTWNLHIIDQMDTLLSLNDKNTTNINAEQNSEFTQNGNLGPSISESNESTRVNFTKASCTLDASVKIYSYRVDDVHLTSYKVLANLNRTQNDKHAEKMNKQIDPNTDGNNDDENIEHKNRRKEQTKIFTGNTLETNIGKLLPMLLFAQRSSSQSIVLSTVSVFLLRVFLRQHQHK
jgi:hypothetical protein